MGDSISHGQYIDPKLRWTSLIADRLDGTYRDAPVQIHSLNRGVSGETSRMGLERFPADVQSIHPDILTLQYGLNDCNCWQTDGGLPRVSPAAFHANLVEMITRSRRFGTKRIILANNHPTLRFKVKPNGLLILAEGFIEGFAMLNNLRKKVGLPPLEPAKINFYSSLAEVLPELERVCSSG